MTPAPALELESVSSGYGRTTVIRNINLSVPASGVTALLGANGVGKTTTLSTASGRIKPSRGRILLNGDDITRLPAWRRAQLGLCHIPEGRAIFRSLTVRDNLELQAPSGVAPAIDEAVAAFPVLGRRIRQTAGTLSGGEQQMLALARTFVNDPKVILVDEASLGLAPLVVDAMFEFLMTMRDRGASLLIVDQFVSRALSLANRVYILSLGEIVFSGTSAELARGEVFERYFGDLEPDLHPGRS